MRKRTKLNISAFLFLLFFIGAVLLVLENNNNNSFEIQRETKQSSLENKKGKKNISILELAGSWRILGTAYLSIRV